MDSQSGSKADSQIGSGVDSRTGAGVGSEADSGVGARADSRVDSQVGAERFSYGEHPDQWIDLYLPAGSVRGVVAIVHGGYWRRKYTAELGEASAQDLIRRGFAVVNIEYRRAEDAGWPGTFEDVVAAVRAIGQTVVADFPMVLLGHSAGGHLAVLAAAHTPVAGVVSQAGILDLAETERRGLSENAARLLMGGTLAELPEEYRAADPMFVNLSVPVIALHSREDDAVPFEYAQAWVDRARVDRAQKDQVGLDRAQVEGAQADGAGLDQDQEVRVEPDRLGSEARFVEVSGSHMDLIAPGTAAHQASVDAVIAILQQTAEPPGR